MIFEFQRELASGEWKALGLSRSGGEDFEVDGSGAFRLVNE
jgi:hypothetical protein